MTFVLAASVGEVEASLKSFDDVALTMTTVGSTEGRNYARVNLKLTDKAHRKRTQKEIEGAIRKQLKPIPGIELAFGFDRAVWVNLLGPDPEMLTTLINQFAEKVAKIQGITDLETSVAAPALSIRLNNDAAADVGINVQQVGATIRPPLAATP
jgi:multidrug efflux pump subunit AcrB